MPEFKCNSCTVCDGKACPDLLPGMGGKNKNTNFILNCSAWEKIRQEAGDSLVLQPLPQDRKVLRTAPVTGAVENFDFPSEESFKTNYIFSAYKAGLALCSGDGHPDIKLRSAATAIKLLRKTDPTVASAFFIKPYSNSNIFQRIDWIKETAQSVGIEIDWPNKHIELEIKTPEQLLEIKEYVNTKLHMPFSLRGIFKDEDIDLVAQVKPDIVVISNQGGRIDTNTGSTAEYLYHHAVDLKKYCEEIWIDGGIRSSLDIKTALALGASQVLAARPFLVALLTGGTQQLCSTVKQMLS
ncbi:MAG: alpha-hydroxy-acid oxidizing protein [Treponema sp.]|nr:alpha-hydroxy-acid oxidizing protein [Treponema sp.]